MQRNKKSLEKEENKNSENIKDDQLNNPNTPLKDTNIESHVVVIDQVAKKETLQALTGRWSKMLKEQRKLSDVERSLILFAVYVVALDKLNDTQVVLGEFVTIFEEIEQNNSSLGKHVNAMKSCCEILIGGLPEKRPENQLIELGSFSKAFFGEDSLQKVEPILKNKAGVLRADPSTFTAHAQKDSEYISVSSSENYLQLAPAAIDENDTPSWLRKATLGFTGFVVAGDAIYSYFQYESGVMFNDQAKGDQKGLIAPIMLGINVIFTAANLVVDMTTVSIDGEAKLLANKYLRYRLSDKKKDQTVEISSGGTVTLPKASKYGKSTRKIGDALVSLSRGIEYICYVGGGMPDPIAIIKLFKHVMPGVHSAVPTALGVFIGVGAPPYYLFFQGPKVNAARQLIRDIANDPERLNSLMSREKAPLLAQWLLKQILWPSVFRFGQFYFSTLWFEHLLFGENDNQALLEAGALLVGFSAGFTWAMTCLEKSIKKSFPWLLLPSANGRSYDLYKEFVGDTKNLKIGSDRLVTAMRAVEFLAIMGVAMLLFDPKMQDPIMLMLGLVVGGAIASIFLGLDRYADKMHSRNEEFSNRIDQFSAGIASELPSWIAFDPEVHYDADKMRQTLEAASEQNEQQKQEQAAVIPDAFNALQQIGRVVYSAPAIYSAFFPDDTNYLLVLSTTLMLATPFFASRYRNLQDDVRKNMNEYTDMVKSRLSGCCNSASTSPSFFSSSSSNSSGIDRRPLLLFSDGEEVPGFLDSDRKKSVAQKVWGRVRDSNKNTDGDEISIELGETSKQDIGEENVGLFKKFIKDKIGNKSDHSEEKDNDTTAYQAL